MNKYIAIFILGVATCLILVYSSSVYKDEHPNSITSHIDTTNLHQQIEIGEGLRDEITIMFKDQKDRQYEFNRMILDMTNKTKANNDHLEDSELDESIEKSLIILEGKNY